MFRFRSMQDPLWITERITALSHVDGLTVHPDGMSIHLSGAYTPVLNNLKEARKIFMEIIE